MMPAIGRVLLPSTSIFMSTSSVPFQDDFLVSVKREQKLHRYARTWCFSEHSLGAVLQLLSQARCGYAHVALSLTWVWHCWDDLQQENMSFSFMVMFFIFFIGCAQAFTLVFGGNLVREAHTSSYCFLSMQSSRHVFCVAGTSQEGFQNNGASMLSLFRALIGDFDVDAMIKVDQLVGPLLFISFIILGSLFLLNVFIAILSEAYEKAKIQVFGDAFDEHDEFWLAIPYARRSPTNCLLFVLNAARGCVEGT